MGKGLYYGRIGGCLFVLIDFLSWLPIKILRWLICIWEVGMLGVMGGDSVDISLHGRRTWFWSVVLFWKICFWRLMFWINGKGAWSFQWVYSVRSAYHLLTHLVPAMMKAHKDVIWNKVIPLKVSLFALRLLNNRWPSKDNMIYHGMHLEDSALCLEGCGVAETIDHLVSWLWYVFVSLD
jgi:hypothetical protein